MKIVVTVLLVFALCAAAAAQTQSERERAGLRGPVSVVRTEVVEFAQGDGKDAAGSRWPLQSVGYNRHGGKSRQTDFNQDGSASQTLIYASDAQGRATGFEEFSGGMTVSRKHVFVLDEKGNRVEHGIVQPDGAKGEKNLYRYDERGRLIEAKLLEHKGALLSRTVYAYDARGRRASQTIYNADDSVSSVSRITYDARGRVTERNRLDGGLLTYRVRYKYDRRGRLVEQETVGSVVEPDFPPAEVHAPGRVVYVYGAAAQPREAIAYGPDGAVRERVLFEYDSHGNWVKRTHLPQSAAPGNSVTRRVEYRHIEYF